MEISEDQPNEKRQRSLVHYVLFSLLWQGSLPLLLVVLADSKAGRGVEKREGFRYALSGSHWQKEAADGLTGSGHLV